MVTNRKVYKRYFLYLVMGNELDLSQERYRTDRRLSEWFQSHFLPSTKELGELSLESLVGVIDEIILTTLNHAEQSYGGEMPLVPVEIAFGNKTNLTNPFCQVCTSQSHETEDPKLRVPIPVLTYKIYNQYLHKEGLSEDGISEFLRIIGFGEAGEDPKFPISVEGRKKLGQLTIGNNLNFELYEAKQRGQIRFGAPSNILKLMNKVDGKLIVYKNEDITSSPHYHN